jgi:hypothetical protein
LTTPTSTEKKTPPSWKLVAKVGQTSYIDDNWACQQVAKEGCFGKTISRRASSARQCKQSSTKYRLCQWVRAGIAVTHWTEGNREWQRSSGGEGTTPTTKRKAAGDAAGSTSKAATGGFQLGPPQVVVQFDGPPCLLHRYQYCTLAYR